MVRSKSAKRFEILAHTVMIFITVCIVLPFILLFMSSITSEISIGQRWIFLFSQNGIKS